MHNALVEKTTSRTIGEELRRAREERGWSRQQLAARLPSGIGERSLLSYEHGTRHLTVIRFIEICRVLNTSAPTLLNRALQRARIHVDNLALEINLRMLLNDHNEDFLPLHPWARNALKANPDGTIEVEPAVVRNLALLVGCQYLDLANHLCKFTPDN